ANVERFFRRTIDPAIVELGFERIEFGTDPLEYGFINVGIFDALHFAEMVIVDVTDHRPNCLIEFGYALGRGLRVIVTATEGTILPFDQQAIPCFFWGANEDLGTQRERFLEFFQKNINRPPIVLQRGSRV
ncbi:MAG TPA: hypothetical protein VJP79_01185, partial [Nitrososphaera sp.]|nr:hypothetical protein [Nitrososphaera sp.]